MVKENIALTFSRLQNRQQINPNIAIIAQPHSMHYCNHVYSMTVFVCLVCAV